MLCSKSCLSNRNAVSNNLTHHPGPKKYEFEAISTFTGEQSFTLCELGQQLFSQRWERVPELLGGLTQREKALLLCNSSKRTYSNPQTSLHEPKPEDTNLLQPFIETASGLHPLGAI